MIDPDLNSDPIHMQGLTGIISRVLYDNYAAYVQFTDDIFGVYSNDSLIMLKPPEIVLENLSKNSHEMDLNISDVLEIFKIYLLDLSKDIEPELESIEVAMESSENIIKTITFTVQDWIDLQEERLDQQQKSGRGR